MKQCIIRRCQTSRKPYQQPLWIEDLVDGIRSEIKIQSYTINGRNKDNWLITITDEDAAIIRLRYGTNFENSDK